MPQPLKPLALYPGDSIRILSLSSPVEEDRLKRGCDELTQLGYALRLDRASVLARDGFFAGAGGERIAALKDALQETATRAIFLSRGGYGSNYLLSRLDLDAASVKSVVGYSDATSLQIYLWQKFRWVTFYGPMVAAGLDKAAGAPQGYDRDTLTRALTETRQGWSIDLRAEPISSGVAEGVLLGGCLTLVETTLATPWELETKGSVLFLEDRAMKPWQVDRALMHLKQAEKFHGVAGIVLGEFPESDAPAGTETVLDVARRILAPLGIPVAWGAPIGHARKPMLTLPLGVRARLSVDAGAKLDILEPAVVA
ncbi:MAG TPA: LD-carboxypeptidase [Candidatus Sulfotelmatobacter sp.]|nr:LD-carboxypeptidase [Candidatus Sulfotelmatobacter sp.]